MNTNASGDLKAAKKDLNDLTQKELKLLEEQIEISKRGLVIEKDHLQLVIKNKDNRIPTKKDC